MREMLQIRKASVNDYIYVQKLMQSVQDLHHNKRSEIHKDSEIFDKEEFNQNINNIIVVEINNTVVGAILYLIKEKLENNYTNYRKVLFIDALVVDQNYRKKGIGKILMLEMEKIAKYNNCSSVELNVWAFNENAIKFYEGMGMSVKTMILEKKLNKHEKILTQ